MKIIFSIGGWNFSYACGELGAAFRRIIPRIEEIASDVAESYFSKKTLVVVRSCPCCCQHDPSFRDPDSVLVSPLTGIDPDGLDIARPKVYPPFRHPGVNGECSTDEEFLEEWRNILEKAVADY